MIFEPIHIFCALGLGFTLGMGLITTLFMRFGCKHEYEVIQITIKNAYIILILMKILLNMLIYLDVNIAVK